MDVLELHDLLRQHEEETGHGLYPHNTDMVKLGGHLLPSANSHMFDVSKTSNSMYSRLLMEREGYIQLETLDSHTPRDTSLPPHLYGLAHLFLPRIRVSPSGEKEYSMGYEHEINKAGKDAFALKPKKADFVKQLQTHIRSLHEAPGRGAAGGLGMEIPLTDEDVAEWRKHASSRAIASQLFAPNAEDDHLYTSDTPISKALPKPHILVTDRRGLKHNGIDFYSYFPETEQLIFKKTTARGD